MADLSPIRQSAKGEVCTVMSSHCNRDKETVILAHDRGGALSLGLKPPDIFACYACSTCHDVLDDRIRHEYRPEELELLFYRAVRRTQKILLRKGLIKYAGQTEGKD
ncbi:MAG: DUF1364 domain-containing protein [Gammaproteobacteria bacterium]|nr:DUF1364 domain-containing protein [Gammaproteobacteria bacterium]